MYGAPHVHSPCAMRLQAGRRWVTPTWCLWWALSPPGCGETATRDTSDRETPAHEVPANEAVTCEALRRLPNAKIEEASATDLVWLMIEPNRSAPLVVNLADARIAGRSGRIVASRRPDDMGAPMRWLVTEQHAISLRRVEREAIEGEWLPCGDTRPTPYSLSPLAWRVPTASPEFVEVARFPKRPSEWPDERTSDMTLVGKQLLVVARGPDGLRVLKRRESGELEEVSHLAAALGDDYNDVVAIDERHVAVASASHGLLVVDLATPEAPEITVTDFPAIAPRDGHSVVVHGTHMLLAQAPVVGTGAVVVFDVSNPAAPRQLSRWSARSGEDAHDVSVRGSRVYVSSLRGGVTILDWKLDDAPRVIARLPGLAAHSANYLGKGNSAGDVTQGSNGFEAERWLWAEERLGGSLHVVHVDQVSGVRDAGVETEDADVSSPARDTVTLAARRLPTRLLAPWGSDEWISSAASPHLAHCEKHLCFVAHYQLGLRVLDLGQAEGEEPQLRAWYPTWKVSERGERTWLRGASGVVVDGTRVYVADTESGIVVLDYKSATPEQE